MIYKVWVCLEAEYDYIKADSAEEAFQIARNVAIAGGSWAWSAEKVQDREKTCDTCIHNPPSSCDGKPCTQCDPDDVYMNCYQEK